MSPEVKSVTAAFVVIFLVIAARHQWLSGFTGWLKAAPKQAAPVNTGTTGPGIVTPQQAGEIPTPGQILTGAPAPQGPVQP